MNFLNELSKTEHNMVLSSYQKYGEFLVNAIDLVNLTFHFIKQVDLQAEVFIIFLSQVQKSLSLALLSTVRRHDVQSQIMLRHVLESAVLASYALFETDINKFVYTDENGYAIEVEQATKDARLWLQENYKIHNDKIKFMKTDIINKSTAHANIITAFNNYDLNNTKSMTTTLFDLDDELIAKQRLWWVSNIAFGMLDLFNSISKDYPVISLVGDFNVKMSALGHKNHELELMLKSEQRFVKHKK